MDLQLVGAGVNSNEYAQVDPTNDALRTSTRPLEWQPNNGVVGGHYSIDAISGAIAAGGITSNQQIFQVRWADPAKLFILKKLYFVSSVTTAFAAGVSAIEAIIGHNTSANGSGGAQVSPTSTSNRMRSTMNASAFVTSGEIRVATTGAITAATGQVLEAAGVGATSMSGVGTTGTYLFEQRDTGTHPLILSPGDSFVVRAGTIAGTGVWTFAISMEWVEVGSY